MTQGINSTSSRRWVLPWPVVPPRLWGPAAACAVVVISLVLSQEIWPHYPQARQWSWLVLAVLLQAGAVQVILVLWVWPVAFIGPSWIRLLLRAAVLAAIAGIVVVQVWLLVISCFVLANSHYGV